MLVLLYQRSDLMLKGLAETQQMADWSDRADGIHPLMEEMPKTQNYLFFIVVPGIFF